MKTFLFLLFVISSFGTLAQSSHVKKDTVRVPSKESNKYSAVLLLYDYFGRPLIDGFHYTYTASLTNKTVTSTVTVDYGDELPKDGATIAIYDTTGILMQSSSYKQSAGGMNIVELSSSIKPGEYHIVIYQGNNRVLLREKFLKQLSK